MANNQPFERLSTGPNPVCALTAIRTLRGFSGLAAFSKQQLNDAKRKSTGVNCVMAFNKYDV